MRPSDKPIGEILLETGAITGPQLEEAVAAHRADPGRRIGEIMIEKGFVTEKRLYQALETRLGVPFAEIAADSLSPSLAELLDETIARKYTLVPIRKTDDLLTVAMIDPMNLYALDDVVFYTRMKTKTVLATRTDVEAAINILYGGADFRPAEKKGEESDVFGEVARLSAQMDEGSEDALVVRFVNEILRQSAALGASDIHIEPLEKTARIRLRVDGVLTGGAAVTKTAQGAAVTRLKVMAGMNPAERRLPQDGRAEALLGGRTMDLRVSVLPTVTGEKAVVRILGGREHLETASSLGLAGGDLAQFESILKTPGGMFLAAGPAGSGRTTTLYAALNELNSDGASIVTVEDPVESRISGISQTQVHTAAGLSFAAGLRAALLQDPDAVMVGELSDPETASAAVRAAVSGRRILSAVPAKDAASAVRRLIDMGVEPYLLAAALSGVAAQRLVRRLCPKCRKPYRPGPEERKLLGEDTPAVLYRPGGCPACGGTGFRGRAAVFEILAVNRDMRALISGGAPADELRACARRGGMRTLSENCAGLVFRGETTVAELLRVMAGVG